MPERAGVGLRTRLAVFFVAITVVPLVVAVVVLEVQMRQQLQDRASVELGDVQRAAVAVLGAQRARAADAATDLADALLLDPLGAALAEGDAGGRAETFLERHEARMVPGRVDLMAVVGPQGDALAVAGRPPAFAAASPDTVAAATDPGVLSAAARGEGSVPGALLEVRELAAEGSEDPLGWVLTLLWTDDRRLTDLGVTGSAALVQGEDVLAVVGAPPDAVPTAAPGDPGDVVDARVAEQDVLLTAGPLLADAPDTGPQLLVWSAAVERWPTGLLVSLVVLTAVVLAGVLGAALASTVVQPLRRAAEVARAVAAGDLSRRLPTGGGRELTDLSRALNAMSEQLRARLADLEAREQQLRRALARLGTSLAASLDLRGILEVVADAALEVVDAERVVVALQAADPTRLVTEVRRGLEAPVPDLVLGEGLLGAAAATGEAVVVPGEAGTPAPVPAPNEPTAPVEVVVPLRAPGRVIGALAVLRDDPGHPFTPSDVEALEALAAQAAVAVENVRLHEEARRLAVTDALTGLWNHRYLRLHAQREVEAAARSGRPLSVVMVDIDRFKRVNDRYGHQVGDAVLVEVARRLREAIRSPDVLGRYGGEEFMVVLADTDAAGAAVTAERIRATVAGRPVHVEAPGDGPAPLAVTCSVGVATMPPGGVEMGELVRIADSALYEAKEAGRDRVVVGRA